MSRDRVYFVSDVHLGLRVGDPAERESRFVSWLGGLPVEETRAVYLLGDIWDFWYEYRDVVPRIGTRVIARLIGLMDEGVEVYFVEGNHDIWTFSFFDELGIRKIAQPYYTELGGKVFCLGHGDGLGKVKRSYALMLKIFHSKAAQAIFSTLHPTIAFRFGLGWSDSNRRARKPYSFRGEEEPLYQYLVEAEKTRHADVYVFGHYHDSVDMTLPSGSRLLVLEDWMKGGCPAIEYNTATGELHCQDGRI